MVLHSRCADRVVSRPQQGKRTKAEAGVFLHSGTPDILRTLPKHGQSEKVQECKSTLFCTLGPPASWAPCPNTAKVQKCKSVCFFTLWVSRPLGLPAPTRPKCKSAKARFFALWVSRPLGLPAPTRPKGKSAKVQKYVFLHPGCLGLSGSLPQHRPRP